MDVMTGFSRSERSRNNFGRHSNCSGSLGYGREKWISDLAWPKHTWLLPFHTYPANCLVSYLLSSMAFTATVCQVDVSGSVGTESFVMVQTPIGHQNITSCNPLTTGSSYLVNDFMCQEGRCQPVQLIAIYIVPLFIFWHSSVGTSW
jgi:hypothetical protein